MAAVPADQQWLSLRLVRIEKALVALLEIASLQAGIDEDRQSLLVRAIEDLVPRRL